MNVVQSIRSRQEIPMSGLRLLSHYGRRYLVLVIGGSTIALVALLTVILSVVSLDNYNQNVDSRAQSRKVLIAAKDLQMSLRDAEIATWQYVLTGDDASRETSLSVAVTVETHLDHLNLLTSEMAHQRARMDMLQPLIPEILQSSHRVVEDRRVGEPTAALVSQLNDPGVRRAAERAQETLDAVSDDENQRISALTTDTDRRATTLAFSLSLLSAINLGLLGVFALYVRRQSREALLQRSNEAKDQFIGLVSHELRNPINTISNAVAVLRRRGADLSGPDRESLLDSIADDAIRLERRVGNMLMVARLEDPDADFEPLLIQRLIPRTVEVHQRRFPSRRVEVRADATLPAVNGDASYFEQVLLNLLGNAEKYGDPVASIEVEAREEEGMVHVAVLDRGEGIDPVLAEQLFRPFFRAAGARGKAQGAGLGLAVCRRLVEMQHGQIWAAPRPGGGSVFEFTLPRSAAYDDEAIPHWSKAEV